MTGTVVYEMDPADDKHVQTAILYALENAIHTRASLYRSVRRRADGPIERDRINAMIDELWGRGLIDCPRNNCHTGEVTVTAKGKDVLELLHQYAREEADMYHRDVRERII